MTTAAQTAPQSGANRKPIIMILVGVGLAAVIAVIAFLLLNSKPSPEELAQEYVDQNSAAMAEEIADYMASSHWILQRLDRKGLAALVRGSTEWNILPAQSLGDDMYEVRVVAHTSVSLDTPWDSGKADAIVPFVLTIDHANEVVFTSSLDYDKAQFQTDLPSIDEVLRRIAEQYVIDKIDSLSEHIAAFLTGNNWLLKELGGEYVEDRIHDVLKWEYQSGSSHIGGDKYEFVAVAYVAFDIDLPSGSANVETGLPFVLTIDIGTQVVDKATPDILGAYLKTDIPDLGSIDISVGEMVGFVTGVAGIKDAADTAEKVLDSAKDKASDALETDCLTAAREAGVPENILDLIQKPKDERSGIENSILRRGLDAVGLSDACADVE